MIRFGGPVFAPADDPRELARAHKAKGYTAAYVPHVPLSDKEKIKAVREAFQAERIMLAEVGYWDNLVDLDEAARKHNMARMTEALCLAEETGARCAVNIFGSYVYGKGDASFSGRNFSDDAFADAVDIARRLIDAVKPKTAFFTYELFPFNIVDSPELIEKLLRAVDREKFGVHLDLCNLINGPRAYFSSGDIMRDCVKRFGDRIVAAHVKDIKLKEPAVSVILEEVLPGEGGIDMHAFVREIHRLPQEVPFMMEHLSSEAEYDRAAAYIRECAGEQNIRI